MDNRIGIREAISADDICAFWAQLRAYFARDVFPDPNDENRAYFLDNSSYSANIQVLHERAENRLRYLFFVRNGIEIGFSMVTVFDSEDGKCFILEFCIFPAFRGGGTGRSCADALLSWAKMRGARYAELNYGGDERRLRFWKRVGFVENGADEWGEPLMLLPPADPVPFTVEVLEDPDDWQLRKLENGFKREIGEDVLTSSQQKRLQQAVKEGSITFFIAKRGYRAVGMCSVAAYYSTFSCANTGVYEDFYVEPAFRGKGVARKLAEAAQRWCQEHGIASLTVCCAPCDEAMYRALGFDTSLGKTFVHIE